MADDGRSPPPIYRSLRDWLLRYIQFQGVSSQSSADIAQRAFLLYFLKYHAIADVNTARLILRSIAFNLIREERKRKVPSVTSDGSLPDLPAETEVEKRELLVRLLSKLPELQREIVILHEINGMTMKEVADVLDITEDTAWGKHRVALKEMRQRLDDDDNNDGTHESGKS